MMTDTEIARRKTICAAAGVNNIGEVSDGFHTFNSLYEQRMILFAALVKAYKSNAWKSYRHEDGEYCFGGGWFVVGIDTPEGSYTYHYENKYWDMFDCIDLPRAPHWDGHTEADAETRLMSLEPEIKTDGDAISRQEAIDAVHKNYDGILDFRSDGETVAQSFEDILTALPSAQPETYKEKLKEIADALSEKFAYMNTCLNERDIILGYLGVKRPSKTHCNTDCTNIKCESYCYNKRLPSAQPEVKTENFEKGLHDMFDHIWDCEIEHPMFQDTVGELMQAVIQLYGRVEQPKHGYWIESHEHIYIGNGVKEWTNWYCSECDAPNDKPTDFCPTCGAKMMKDGER